MKLTIAASNRDRLSLDNDQGKWFLKSLQWQTFEDFEILIVDGGSKNYKELYEHFSKPIGPIPVRIIQHKMGPVFERALLNNVGIINAKADFVMTTDVDMLYHKDFIQDLMARMDVNKLVESRTLYLRSKAARSIYSRKYDPYTEFDKCKHGKVKNRTTAGGCQCMHKLSWLKIGGFDERYYGWGSEDTDVLNRCRKANIKIEWMGEPTGTVKLFHQPHFKSRETIRQDLKHQNENKKILGSVKHYKANPDGWGGVTNEKLEETIQKLTEQLGS